jgi:peroxiredoxin
MTDPAAPQPDPTTPAPESASVEGAAAQSAVSEAVAEIVEGKNDTIGVMASVSTWIVPSWIKVVTFVVSVITIGGLVYEQVDKRRTFLRLLVDSVVEPEPWKPKPAPEFSLPKGAGPDTVALSSFKGSWVLLNYWATWCPPCRDEMPSLEMLTRRMTRDHGTKLQIVTVSVDEDYNEVNRFFGATAPTFHVLWDRQKSAAGAYGTSRFPETYLIDPEGRIAAKFTGPRDWYNQGMVQYFSELVTGKRKPVS